MAATDGDANTDDDAATDYDAVMVAATDYVPRASANQVKLVVPTVMVVPPMMVVPMMMMVASVAVPVPPAPVIVIPVVATKYIKRRPIQDHADWLKANKI